MKKKPFIILILIASIVAGLFYLSIEIEPKQTNITKQIVPDKPAE